MTKAKGAFLKFQFGATIRGSLYEKIPVFLEKGIPLFDILNKLAEKYEKNKKGDIRSAIINEVIFEMETGKSFSEAFAKWVPPGEAMLLSAGEKSGSLPQALEGALFSSESSKRIKSVLIAELSYPVVLIVALISLMLFFAYEIIPQLEAVLPIEFWPPMSKKLSSISSWLRDYWPFLILFMALNVAVILVLLPRLVGRVRSLLDNIFPWNIYKTIQSSSFLVSLSILMESGVPIADAIKDIQSMSSKYVYPFFDEMLYKLSSGKDIGESINSGFIDKEPGLDVEIYSETGSMQEGIKDIGRRSIIYGIASIKLAAGVMRNIAILGITVYIGWVYYGLFMVTKTIGEISKF